jgi:hypothetical protein
MAVTQGCADPRAGRFPPASSISMFNTFGNGAPLTTLLVGPDDHGHWLVQEQGGALEGSFVSQAAALQFARWERHAYPHARVELSATPLVPRLAP